jgi:hypothetical protein
MPLVKNVEKKIYDIEDFDVVILRDGKDVRGDASLPTQFAGQKRTKNSATVADFRAKFQRQYPGYSVNVLLANGDVAPGQTQLGTVRDTYIGEEE